MKILISLFIFITIFISCSLEQLDSNKYVINKDSILKIDSFKTEYATRLFNKVNTLKKLLALSEGRETVANAQIDAYQKDILKYQNDIIHLKSIEIQLKNFMIENKELIEKLEIIKRKNKELIVSNSEIENKLKETTINLYKATNENNDYKKSIKFNIANVEIKAYTFIRQFSRKNSKIPKFHTDTVETLIAKDVKFIKITFVSVANDKVEKRSYELGIKISYLGVMGITKKRIIDYQGNEIKSSIVFDDPNEFQSGFHHVEIKMKDRLLHSGVIELK